MARITKPVLIIAAPRSGSTLLYELLSEHPELWSIGGESRRLIEARHHPREKDWESGALDPADLSPSSREYLLREFVRNAASGRFWRQVNRLRGWLRGREGWQRLKARGRAEGRGSGLASRAPGRGLAAIQRFVRLRNALMRPPLPIRLLEKTPENCLRLPFLLELFPDARVIHLVRDGRANVSSLIEGWRQPHLFPGYRPPVKLEIAGDVRGRWAFTLIPGWRELAVCSVEEICAWQWVRSNEAVLDFRDSRGAGVPWFELRYEGLVDDPTVELERLASFLELAPGSLSAAVDGGLPPVNVVTAPGTEKWRRHEAELEAVAPIMAPMMERLGYGASSS